MKIRQALLVLGLAVALAVAACAPAPAAVVKETVPVPQTVIVSQTVAVPVAQTVVVPQTVVVQATPPAQPTKPAVEVKAVDLTAIQKAWQGGPHNNLYDLYRGPNTGCAQCHSPRNWDPKATVGTPPNCWSCKFPYDAQVRISPKAPLIQESDWKKIGCDVCHPNGQGPAIAIWNNGTGKFDAVSTATELCEKCHTDSLGASRHQVRLGGGAHSNQIGTTVDRPDQCTDCHDPHKGAASCVTGACHTKLSTREGHGDAAHANVRCVACHDRSKMEIGFEQVTDRAFTGPAKTTKIFGTVRSVTLTDRSTAWIRSTSHDYNKSVGNACATCHAPSNKWGIYAFTPTPTRAPATPTATKP